MKRALVTGGSGDLGSAIGELTGYLAGRGGRALIPQRRRAQFEQLQRLTDRYGAALLVITSEKQSTSECEA